MHQAPPAPSKSDQARPASMVDATNDNNVAIGLNVLNVATSSQAMIAIGTNALQNMTSYIAGVTNYHTVTSGDTAIGFNALQFATSSSEMTAVGNGALQHTLSIGISGNGSTVVVLMLLRATHTDNEITRLETRLSMPTLLETATTHLVGLISLPTPLVATTTPLVLRMRVQEFSGRTLL